MVFSSPAFLFIFLPLVFVIYKVVPRSAKNAVLIAASLIFYAWGEPVFVLLLLASVCVNYFVARLMGDKAEARPRAKLWLVLGVIFNVGMLAVFKYANFLVETVNSVFAAAIPVPGIRLPLGISFYTFQALSYIIDVYRGAGDVQKRFSGVLLHISMFPQLISGPIVKYHEFAPQIHNRIESAEKTAEGLKRFTVGLAKKQLIAYAMGQIADKVFALNTAGMSSSIAWVGAAAYSLQLYYDFSGYSDMAIGVAKLFGFDIRENFEYPYTATSVQSFWRKWHISLSTWFREYLYIPLGGNRKGKARTLINLLIVFFCTGLWHGAMWTFVVWGMVHGLFMLLERVKVIPTERKTDKKWLAAVYGFFGNVYTLVVVVTAFVIFRADSIGYAFEYIARMFTGAAVTEQAPVFLKEIITPFSVTMGIIALIGATPHPKRIYLAAREKKPALVEAGSMVLTLAMLFVCIMTLASQSYNPFIYFRF